jgi:hypothetical protein
MSVEAIAALDTESAANLTWGHWDQLTRNYADLIKHRWASTPSHREETRLA